MVAVEQQIAITRAAIKRYIKAFDAGQLGNGESLGHRLGDWIQTASERI